MKLIHYFIQNTFVLLIITCFTFVALYTPQNWNQIEKAEAALATTGGQAMINATNILQLAKDTITSAATVAIEWFQSSIWTKEWVLDGIGWWVAKMIISQVTRHIVTWINSGFQGSPAFVQDLEAYALNLADKAAGLYLANLGSPLLTQFVCAPFRLNLRIAIASSYRYNRSGFPYGTSRCSLTQAMQNIDRFTNGSFIQGGWNAWYTVSAQPMTYTPYGEYLAAKSELALRASISVRNENRLVHFGQGFMSKKICDVISTGGVKKEKCLVSTPGDVIADSLNFHLTAGTRSLIAADEINEIIGALLGQLAQTAITGANGLLGTSNNTGYTDPTISVDTMSGQQQIIGDKATNGLTQKLDEAIDKETNYLDFINILIPILTTLNTSKTIAAAAEASFIKTEIEALLLQLNAIKNDLLTGTVPLNELMERFGNLKLHTDTQINAKVSEWQNYFITEFEKSLNTLKEAARLLEEYYPKLNNYVLIGVQPYVDLAKVEINLIDTVYRPLVIDQTNQLNTIAANWNNPNIPKIDVVQAYINLVNGAGGTTPLITDVQVAAKVTEWQRILDKN